MSRSSKPTDFRVSVDGVGDFVFAKRTMRDEIATQVGYARLIDGVTPTPWLETVCGAIADLKTLTVKGPDGWDIDALEPHDPETYKNLLAVHRELINKERSFRPGAASTDKAAGTRTGEDGRVQVSPAV